MVATKSTKNKSLIGLLGEHKIYVTIIAILLFGLVSYIVIFSVKKSVVIAGYQESCVDQLVLLPTKHQTADKAFTIRFKDPIIVGSKKIASQSICFTPQFELQSGTYEAKTSLYGALFAQKVFTITVL
jgi:hypothetical protein